MALRIILREESFFIFAVVGFLSVALQAWSADEGWKRYKEENGIIIYEVNPAVSSLSGFKAETVISANIDVVFRILRDIPNYHEWYGDNKSIKIVKLYSTNHFLAHYIIHVPWPFTDRDLIVDMDFLEDQSGGQMQMILKRVAQDAIPPNSKFVRIPQLRGKCTLNKIDEKHTKAVYYVLLDVGGYLPSAIADFIIKDDAYMNILRLKELAIRKARQ